MKWDKLKIEKRGDSPSLDHNDFLEKAFEKTTNLAFEILSKDVELISKRVKELYGFSIDFFNLVDVFSTVILLCNSGFDIKNNSCRVKSEHYEVFLKKITLLLNLLNDKNINIDWVTFLWTIEHFTNSIKCENGVVKKVTNKEEFTLLLKTIYENLENTERIDSTSITGKTVQDLAKMSLPTIVGGRTKKAFIDAGINNMKDLYDYKGKLWNIERVGNGNTVHFLRKFVAEKFPELKFYCLEE